MNYKAVIHKISRGGGFLPVFSHSVKTMRALKEK